ncbi:MAG: hypothetical protein NTX16_03955 [Actinobacteria bacterium]|nr:hypothetical protein [Actinomycetota bacterium]
MKRGLLAASLLIVLALLPSLAVVVSACGESTRDEFVGTWRRFDYKTEWSPPLVIVKTDSGYRGTLVYSDAQPQWELRRAGDTLKGEAWSSRGPVELIVRGPAGRIALRGAAMPGHPVNEVLDRPANERPFLVLVVGYPAADAQVPALTRKSQREITTFL